MSGPQKLLKTYIFYCRRCPMRVTKRTNIAMRLMMFCAITPDKMATKTEISKACNTSANHLAQIINQLAQLGFVQTQRGRNGGLRLSRPADQISVGEVFRALEGDLPLTECFADADNTCPLTSACRLRVVLSDAARAFYETLDAVTLDALVCDNAELSGILGLSLNCGGAADQSRLNAAENLAN